MQKWAMENGREGFQRIICTSATHVGFIAELGKKDYIIGATTPELIYSLTDDERQRIINIGSDVQFNKEAILRAKPDLIFTTTYGPSDDRTQALQSLGIPVVYCHEWTEQHPLARAEWIRFFGALLGCLPQADSVYNAVSNSYHANTVSQHTCTHQRGANNVSNSEPHNANTASLMSGMSWRGTWYVPTGGTFMGQLFRDAGAEYKYLSNSSTSSLPLTFEQALQDFADADIWVGCDANTLAELAAIDAKHKWLKAYQNGQVYNFRRRILPSGANDFWESGVVHPERILQDLRAILEGDTTTLYYSAPLRKE